MKRSIIKHTVLISLIIMLLTGNSAFAQTISVTDMTQFKDAVISNMVDRNTSFTISYTGETNKIKSKVNDYVGQAYSTNDYLRWSWTSISPKVVTSDGKSDITIEISYISTKDQEKYVDEETNKIISKIITIDMTNKDKIEAIHDFVLKTVEYDYTLQSKSPYLALTTGKTICQGYAMLVYKLCEKAEIPVRIVTGNVPAGYHAWNMVQIDGSWYHIDTTFDDVQTGQYKFFCASDEFMVENGYKWNNRAFPKTSIIYKDDITAIVK